MVLAFRTNKLPALWLLAISILLGACGNGDKLPAAPINDKSTLEKLASAYNQVRGEFPVAPTGLNASGKRKFVEKVFAQAGFSYSKTLLALSTTTPKQQQTQFYKDMKQLVQMPGTGLSNDTLSEIYSQEEIEAWKNIASQ